MSNTENVVDSNLADGLIQFFSGMQDQEQSSVPLGILDELKNEFLKEREAEIKRIAMGFLAQRQDQINALRRYRQTVRKEEKRILDLIDSHRRAAALALQGLPLDKIYEKLKED